MTKFCIFLVLIQISAILTLVQCRATIKSEADSDLPENVTHCLDQLKPFVVPYHDCLAKAESGAAVNGYSPYMYSGCWELVKAVRAKEKSEGCYGKALAAGLNSEQKEKIYQIVRGWTWTTKWPEQQQQ